jgi:hypothetical protein
MLGKGRTGTKPGWKKGVFLTTQPSGTYIIQTPSRTATTAISMKYARLPQLLSTSASGIRTSLTPLLTLLRRVLSAWDHSFLGKDRRRGSMRGVRGRSWLKTRGRRPERAWENSKEDVSRVFLYCVHPSCFPPSFRPVFVYLYIRTHPIPVLILRAFIYIYVCIPLLIYLCLCGLFSSPCRLSFHATLN